jgi:hypothetical protein
MEDKELKGTPAKPFPYWPPEVSVEERKRMEVMIELNKWAYNDPFMAKRSAETLIMLLAQQFDIKLIKTSASIEDVQQIENK